MRGYQACRILASTLEGYAGYLDNVVVGSFSPDVEACLALRYPTLLRGASTTGAMDFILSEMLFLNRLDASGFACLQIPASYNIYITTVKLDNARYISRAHSRNIAVQYWTVNDEETMRKLIELGCDCIITDNPALLSRVLEDYC